MVEERKEEHPAYLCQLDGRDHGHVGEGATWRSLLPELGPQGEIRGDNLSAAIGERSGLITNNSADVGHLPDMLFDEHNCELFDNVHPI